MSYKFENTIIFNSTRLVIFSCSNEDFRKIINNNIQKNKNNKQDRDKIDEKNNSIIQNSYSYRRKQIETLSKIFEEKKNKNFLLFQKVIIDIYYIIRSKIIDRFYKRFSQIIKKYLENFQNSYLLVLKRQLLFYSCNRIKNKIISYTYMWKSIKQFILYYLLEI